MSRAFDPLSIAYNLRLRVLTLVFRYQACVASIIGSDYVIFAGVVRQHRGTRSIFAHAEKIEVRIQRIAFAFTVAIVP